MHIDCVSNETILPIYLFSAQGIIQPVGTTVPPWIAIKITSLVALSIYMLNLLIFDLPTYHSFSASAFSKPHFSAISFALALKRVRVCPGRAEALPGCVGLINFVLLESVQ